MPRRLLISLTAILGLVSFVYYASSPAPGKAFSNGELSIKHKNIEGSCERCHLPWEGPSERLCKACHAPLEHPRQQGPDGDGVRGRGPASCADCHPEHKGRRHDLKATPDRTCSGCHMSRVHTARAEGHPRPGIILTHASQFERVAYGKVSCAGRCHVRELNEDGFIKDYMLDVMFSHLERTDIRCMDCHEKVEVRGFSASGGGVTARKCLDCHNARKVSDACVACHRYHSGDGAGPGAGATPSPPSEYSARP